MKILFIVITIITFFIFFIEGLIHYNAGLKVVKDENIVHKPIFVFKLFDGFEIEVPDKKELLYMAFTVLVFSSIAGLLNAYVIKYHLNG